MYDTFNWVTAQKTESKTPKSKIPKVKTPHPSFRIQNTEKPKYCCPKHRKSKVWNTQFFFCQKVKIMLKCQEKIRYSLKNSANLIAFLKNHQKPSKFKKKIFPWTRIEPAPLLKTCLACSSDAGSIPVRGKIFFWIWRAFDDFWKMLSNSPNFLSYIKFFPDILAWFLLFDKKKRFERWSVAFRRRGFDPRTGKDFFGILRAFEEFKVI